MKINKIFLLSGVVMSLASCNDYLDKLPDSRTTLDSEEKITAMLVSAYPSNNAIIIEEMASDNAMDNGMRYSIEDKMQEEAYRWQEITNTDSDSPKALWSSCYGAVAAANHALEAIDEMGNPASLQPQRGEALLCRAWGHFLLSNVFCAAYNPETANTDLGLPYATEPETTVRPGYERGTLQQLYDNIEKDLTEGLPLINDELYDVPKYHFNKKAAYAFAARFYLYFHKWDKVIECANQVLGADPTSMLRDWATLASMAFDFESRSNAYVSTSEPSNLLLQTAYSSMVYWLGPYNLGTRYGYNESKICNSEGFGADGIWGSSSYLYMATSAWAPLEQKIFISKYNGYFEFVDKVQQIGYRRNVIVQLCADETLLCRAEAYANLGDYDNAVKDINYWMSTNVQGSPETTLADIDNFYGNMAYMEDANGKPLVASEAGTPKKRLHPLGISLRDASHENLIHCILFMRRCQTSHEGLRWMDIKRWGIEIAHNNDGAATDYLLLNDPRRVFQIPADVVDAGIEPNPTVLPAITNNQLMQ